MAEHPGPPPPCRSPLTCSASSFSQPPSCGERTSGVGARSGPIRAAAAATSANVSDALTGAPAPKARRRASPDGAPAPAPGPRAGHADAHVDGVAIGRGRRGDRDRLVPLAHGQTKHAHERQPRLARNFELELVGRRIGHRALVVATATAQWAHRTSGEAPPPGNGEQKQKPRLPLPRCGAYSLVSTHSGTGSHLALNANNDALAAASRERIRARVRGRPSRHRREGCSSPPTLVNTTRRAHRRDGCNGRSRSRRLSCAISRACATRWPPALGALAAMAFAGTARADGPAFGRRLSAPAGRPAPRPSWPTCATASRTARSRTPTGSAFGSASPKRAASITEPSRRSTASVRDVEGRSYGEVARALVVFLALALSPRESTSNEPHAPSTKPAPALPESGAANPRKSRPSYPRERRGLRFGADVSALGNHGNRSRHRLRRRAAREGRARAELVASMDLSRGRPRRVRGGVGPRRRAHVRAGRRVRVDGGPAIDLETLSSERRPRHACGRPRRRSAASAEAQSYSSFWGDFGLFARVDRSLTSSVALSLDDRTCSASPAEGLRRERHRPARSRDPARRRHALPRRGAGRSDLADQASASHDEFDRRRPASLAGRAIEEQR